MGFTSAFSHDGYDIDPSLQWREKGDLYHANNMEKDEELLHREEYF